jgi:hypothetical protein
MKSIRVFFAHSIKHEPEEIEALMQQCKESMQVRYPQLCFLFTAGRDDWQERMPVMGSWDAWCESVAGSLPDGSPRYQWIVIPTAQHWPGAATLKIAKHADREQRIVISWDERTDTVQPWS